MSTYISIYSTTHVCAKVWQSSYYLSIPSIFSGKRGNQALSAWTKGGKVTFHTVYTEFSYNVVFSTYLSQERKTLSRSSRRFWFNHFLQYIPFCTTIRC